MKEHPQLNLADTIWIKDVEKLGVVVRKSSEPGSYIIKIDKNCICRNRFHLFPCKGKKAWKKIHPRSEPILYALNMYQMTPTIVTQQDSSTLSSDARECAQSIVIATAKFLPLNAGTSGSPPKMSYPPNLAVSAVTSREAKSLR